MKNRVKIVTTLILLLIILLAMCLGIYAMVTSKGEIEGTVTYYANYVSADIYGRIDGYDKSGGTLKEFNDEISPSAPSGVSKVWDIGAVNFSRDKNDWSYGIKDDGEGNLIEDDLIEMLKKYDYIFRWLKNASKADVISISFFLQ